MSINDRLRRAFIIAGLLAVAVPGRPLAAAPNKAAVTLESSVQAIVPGRPFDVGLRFKQDEGWHIYWQNSGDSGLPPTIEWKLPEGFSAGEIRFPTPKRHVSPGDIITNVLPGEPVLLVAITPSANAMGTAKLAGLVRYLICNQNCIQEQAEVSLGVPVQDAGSEPKPANEELFNRARRAQPKESSKYVTVTPSLSTSAPAPGTKFDLLVNVEIAKGHHIQSHNPGLPTLIPADLFVERRPGARFERPIFPEGKTRSDKYLGTLSEYEGRITVRVPGEVSSEPPPAPLKVGGVFTFQACDEHGHCFPPEAVAFSTIVGSADASTSVAPTTTTTEAAAPEPADVGGLEGFLGRFGIIGLLVGCFLYGLFINATPCVLPLLSIKVLSFVHQAHDSRKRTLMLGLAFGAGVMVFFVVLGLLAAAGTNILQYPEAVIGLGTVVLAMGLSMLGVFTLQPPNAATALEASIQKEGPASSFGKGALAPVLGFACTGPLLAGAFGWATQQPPQLAIVAFLMMGLGMAFPYMLLGANPHWLSFLPKPGNWMIVFERIMGFLLMAMVIWLLHPLVVQIGVTGLEWTLVFLVFVGLACWILGQVTFTMSTGQRWRYRGAAVAMILLAGGVIYEGVFPLDEAVAAARAEREALANCGNGDDSDRVPWQPWSQEAVDQAVQAGKMVFVDFTSEFCTICKVNKKIAINTPEFTERAKALGVALFRADFTNQDDSIANALIRFKGSILLPFYLIYPPGKLDAPIKLDGQLTKAFLLQKLDEAGAVQSASAAAVGS